MKVVIISIAEHCWEQQQSLLREAAEQLSTDVEMWLIGNRQELSQRPTCNAENSPQVAICEIPCDLPSPTVADYIALLQPMIIWAAPRVVMMDGSVLSRELATRLAFRTGGRSIIGVTAAVNSVDGLTVTRGIYSFNLNASFTITESPAVLALLTHVQPEESDGGSLETASLVLAMGRGAGNEDSRGKLCEVAHRIGAVVGGTRPAALDGFLPIERMLGISGTSVNADICITFGASGATPFMMGINDSKLLVAVNSDPRALIFRYCDIGLCDNSKDVAEELLKLIPKRDD